MPRPAAGSVGGPVSPAARVDPRDVLRGFALLGILAVNIQLFAMPAAAYFNPAAFGARRGPGSRAVGNGARLRIARIIIARLASGSWRDCGNIELVNMGRCKMARRCLVGLCLVAAAAWLFPAGAAGQTQEAASDGWTVSRTTWDDPDLEGVWSFATITPLERPGRYAGRDRLTAEEVTALNQDALTRGDQPPPPGDTGGYNAFWFDRGESTGRTSLIVDPPDGRIPFTAVGSARRDARRALLERPAHGPEDRTPGERCVHHSKAGPPMSAGGYNNHLRVLQAPGYVVIWTEQNHDARIVPLDGRPRIADAIRQWMGDSRGRWEGDTLVVETTNFNGKAAYQGSADGMRLVERFTRTAPDTIRYTYTVSDPETYTRPWTASIDLQPMAGDLYEFACHEGNYGLEGILAGARADERRAAAR